MDDFFTALVDVVYTGAVLFRNLLRALAMGSVALLDRAGATG